MAWKINYNGWRITHDPSGELACYRLEGDTLEWCYFGNNLKDIKAEIDRREELENMGEDEEDEIVLEISRINIKSETFCTPWEGNLYCVDICEDAEERSAWLYRHNCGHKVFMFGYMVKDMDADEYKDLVFSNLPEYIESYEDEMDMLEGAY